MSSDVVSVGAWCLVCCTTVGQLDSSVGAVDDDDGSDDMWFTVGQVRVTTVYGLTTVSTV